MSLKKDKELERLALDQRSAIERELMKAGAHQSGGNSDFWGRDTQGIHVYNP